MAWLLLALSPVARRREGTGGARSRRLPAVRGSQGAGALGGATLGGAAWTADRLRARRCRGAAAPRSGRGPAAAVPLRLRERASLGRERKPLARRRPGGRPASSPCPTRSGDGWGCWASRRVGETRRVGVPSRQDLGTAARWPSELIRRPSARAGRAGGAPAVARNRWGLGVSFSLLCFGCPPPLRRWHLGRAPWGGLGGWPPAPVVGHPG